MNVIERIVREKTADAALALWQCPRNIPELWFREADPRHIRSMAERMAKYVLVEHLGYREQRGSRAISAPGSELYSCAAAVSIPRSSERLVPALAVGSPIRLDEEVIGYVGGENPIADAAQWLWAEWGSPRHWLEDAYPAEIVHDYSKAYALDIKKVISRKPIEDKKYSLSDLRRAYDMGFGASGEGWNQEVHPDYVDKENYQAERQEALREFK